MLVWNEAIMPGNSKETKMNIRLYFLLHAHNEE